MVACHPEEARRRIQAYRPMCKDPSQVAMSCGHHRGVKSRRHRRSAFRGPFHRKLRMTRPIELHPERLAELEAGGWRAYYDRDWPKLIRLMVQLNQEQFHIPFPLSLVAALHVARGSIAWAPVKNDPRVVRRHFTRFYRMARRWSGMTFEPGRAAELEG